MPRRLDRQWTSHSDCASDSGYSDFSDHSQSTAPTTYSYGSRRPSLKHHETAPQPYNANQWGKGEKERFTYDYDVDHRVSRGTYATTVPSAEDLDEDLPPFEIPDWEQERFESTAIPSNPTDFAEYFPSTQRLHIKHDDSTLDGNMNLRIDTEIRGTRGQRADLTLFHLRMHDLKNRDFSLRRYCRDSGREVCHSSRKYTTPASAKRPSLQRSMSNALSSFRSKAESNPTRFPGLKRQDSGYDSMTDDDESEEHAIRTGVGRGSVSLPTNTTKLEFSNYAHLDIKRRGTKGSKKYEFEYWGKNYAWKRVSRRRGDCKETSYHLVNAETSQAIAHIVPAVLTPAEAEEEDAKGGWVPPCSLWINDEKVVNGRTDVAEAIVATGLIALVDDCIKARWHQKSGINMTIPSLMKSPLKLNMEYIGPKRLIDEVFNRRGHAASRRSTPLRQISAKS